MIIELVNRIMKSNLKVSSSELVDNKERMNEVKDVLRFIKSKIRNTVLLERINNLIEQ